MATSKPRYPITIEPEIMKIIEGYKKKHNLRTTSGATVELLLKGINDFYKNELPDKITKAEREHIRKYRELDERGRSIVDTVLCHEHSSATSM